MHLKLFTIVLLISFRLSACQPARTRTGPVVIDRNELQNLADAFFAEQMETLHIPGVVLVFVQKGEVIFVQRTVGRDAGDDSDGEEVSSGVDFGLAALKRSAR